jgi:hypothetical protein
LISTRRLNVATDGIGIGEGTKEKSSNTILWSLSRPQLEADWDTAVEIFYKFEINDLKINLFYIY